MIVPTVEAITVTIYKIVKQHISIIQSTLVTSSYAMNPGCFACICMLAL